MLTGLPDGSVKPGEALCVCFVLDLQRTAEPLLNRVRIMKAPKRYLYNLNPAYLLILFILHGGYTRFYVLALIPYMKII